MTDDLLARFTNYCRENALFETHSRILLAVSGGIDSMVLLDLCRRGELNIAVAHMNYNLRGQDSILDASIVRDYCLKYHIAFYEKVIPPSSFPAGNIQEIARNLRYNWFNELSILYSWDRLATGHHQDDAVETMLMHMMTGSGVQGLASLMLSKKRVIRPMLCANRQDISLYASAYEVPFREDQSNNSTYYKRNLIRHKLLPEIYKSEPRSKMGLAITVDHLAQEAGLLNEVIHAISLQEFQWWLDCARISSNFGKTYQYRTALLYQVFKPYGFRHAQIKLLIQGMDIGSCLDSKEYRLFVERFYWYLIPKHLLDHQKASAETIESFSFVWNNSPFFEISCDFLTSLPGNHSQYQLLDSAKIKWPICIRIRQPGDKMHIYFGRLMTKSIKKLLSDAKIDSYFKSYYPVILDAENEIICLPGICLSPKVLPDKLTKQYTEIRFKMPFQVNQQ